MPPKAQSNNAVLTRLRRNARRAMDRHPGVEAVLLFGSRARGEHEEDSDVDVAVVTRHEAPDDLHGALYDTLEAGCDAVLDLTLVAKADLLAQGHLLGNFAYTLRKRARPLAGRWPLKELPPMPAKTIPVANDTMKEFLGQMAYEIQNAAIARARFADHTAEKKLTAAVNDDKQFQRAVQMALELWAKSVLMVLGVEPVEIHDMAKLGQRLIDHAPGDPLHLAWGKTVKALNGGAVNTHQTVYDKSKLEPIPVADNRFQRGLRAIGDWLDDALLVARATAAERPLRTAMLQEAKEQIVEAVGYVERQQETTLLPADIAQALLRLESRCRTPNADAVPRPKLTAAANPLQARAQPPTPATGSAPQA